jgi:murein DD-endopeptidase MepM/ murein hydrolase activator NlpD
MMKKNRSYNTIILVILSLYTFSAWGQTTQPPMDEMVILSTMPLNHQSYVIKKNSSVHQSLMEAGIDSQIIYEIVKNSKPIFNLRHIQPGTRYTVSRTSDNKIRRVSFEINPLTRLEVNYSDDTWTSDITEVETTTKLVHFSGSIKDSLWSSAVEQHLSPEVIVDFAEVFGWQVDFNREVRAGDQWNFTVEKLFAEGRAVGWGPIVYAEYQNKETTHKAYFYKNKAANTRGYFDENGNSLRKVFLKSPIKFGRITSGFSRRRFHPIQRRYKAHNGVDYGAPRGTPIRAIGNGRVIKLGRFGGSGNMIVLDHVAGYQTKYLHLSRFQKGVRNGSQVLQGQTIGYVGSTGFSTGPHLHFEMSKHNQIIDPLKVNLPTANPIPPSVLSSYKEHITNVNRDIASVFKKPKNNLLCCNTGNSRISPSQLQ